MESISYAIYVTADVSGKCGAYTNSAGFKKMELEASFQGIVFLRPMGKGIPGPYGGMHRATEPAFFVVAAGMYLDGTGILKNVEYCPQYETEDLSYPVKIIGGPNPFKALIGVMSPTPSDTGGSAKATKTPAGGGEAWVMFSIGDALNGGNIVDYEIRGDKGGDTWGTLGNSVRFITSWNQLMKGEAFTITMETGDEGETWKWEMSFHPEPIM